MQPKEQRLKRDDEAWGKLLPAAVIITMFAVVGLMFFGIRLSPSEIHHASPLSNSEHAKAPEPNGVNETGNAPH